MMIFIFLFIWLRIFQLWYNKHTFCNLKSKYKALPFCVVCGVFVFLCGCSASGLMRSLVDPDPDPDPVTDADSSWNSAQHLGTGPCPLRSYQRPLNPPDWSSGTCQTCSNLSCSSHHQVCEREPISLQTEAQLPLLEGYNQPCLLVSLPSFDLCLYASSKSLQVKYSALIFVFESFFSL